MKWLILVPVAAALGGCVAYGPGAYDPYYGSSTVYYGTYHDGRAMRDRDRDGIPNRYDRDRDGDGVPNRYDRAPNDWRRN
jgi:hypothetical protein